jgi:hypothetical protein
MAEPRIHRADVGKVAKHPRETEQPADAGADLLETILRDLVQQLRVRQKRPANLPEPEGISRQGLFRLDRVAKARTEGHWYFHRSRRVFRQRQPLVVMHVPPQRSARRFMPAHHDANAVGTGLLRHFHELDALGRAVAAMLIHQFVAVQADNQELVFADLLADRSQEFHHEAAAVFERAAIFVGAPVGERRQEICQQVAHERRNFYAVKARFHGAPARLEVLLDGTTDFAADLARRTEVSQSLRHIGRLDAMVRSIPPWRPACKFVDRIAPAP